MMKLNAACSISQRLFAIASGRLCIAAQNRVCLQAMSAPMMKQQSRLCSSEKMKEMNIDYKVDKLDSWILYKFGPKDKYPTLASVPKLCSRAEIESAKSKFRIFINLIAIATLIVTASYLVYGARGERAKHEAEVVEKQKSIR